MKDSNKGLFQTVVSVLIAITIASGIILLVNAFTSCSCKQNDIVDYEEKIPRSGSHYFLVVENMGDDMFLVKEASHINSACPEKGKFNGPEAVIIADSGKVGDIIHFDTPMIIGKYDVEDNTLDVIGN